MAVGIEAAPSHVWTYDIEEETLTRFTFESVNRYPVWTPDGERIAFASPRVGLPDIFWKSSDGSGTMEALTRSNLIQVPSSCSPDGSVLAFTVLHPETGDDIWVLPVEEEEDPQAFLATKAHEEAPAFSPDGAYLAYSSDESDRSEIYVQPFPGPAGKWQISTDGGSEPLWSPDGTEIFYRQGANMMVVPVSLDPSFRHGSSHVLFESGFSQHSWRNYDITPDGQHFLMIEPAEESPPARRMVFVLHWSEELKRLVPTTRSP